jgi:hypothetical protein
MVAAVSQDISGLVVMNILLLVFCVGSVLAVAVAVWGDLRERRRWRALVPPCWPPPGADPDEAYATRSSLARPARGRRSARKEISR